MMMTLIGEFIHEMFILYGIILLGFIVRKTGVLNKHATEVLTQLTLYITLPALILFSLDMSFSFIIFKQMVWLLVMSMVAMTSAIFLAAWMRKRSNLSEAQKVVYEGITIFGNQGFIGFAVIYILFHNEGIMYLTIFNIFYLILIWTYGIYLFTKDTDTIDWKKVFFNPGIFSTLIGLILLFTPLSMPEKLSSTIENIGKMTIPLSLMIIGCLIADIHFNKITKILKSHYIWLSAFVRLLLIPFIVLPFYFISAPFPILATAVIVSGMPSASTISLYAQKFGGDSYFASIGVLLTTFLCIFTIPLLYLIVQLLY